MKIFRLAAAILGLAAVPALAQTFGTELRLNPHGAAAISNNPAIHASGNNVYIAWATFTGGQREIYVKRSTDNGANFGAAVNVSNRPGADDVEPIIVGDGTSVHVFWTDAVADGALYYARSGDNGSSFTAAVALTGAAGGAYSRPTDALINGTEVHLVFYSNSPNLSVGKVYHKRSCNSGVNWQADVDVTQFDGDVDNEQPRLVRLSTGDIIMSYRSSAGGVPQGGWPPFQIYTLRMAGTGCAGGNPSGNTAWLYPAQRVSRGSQTDLGGNYAAMLVPGASGGMHLAWWNDTAGTNLMYRYGRPNGNGLGAVTNVSGFGLNHQQWEHMTERLGYGIGEDASGRVHAIFQQNQSLAGIFQTGSLWYTCSPTAGGTFVTKQLLTGGTVSEPRAVYSNNKFHVVWQDYRFAAGTEQSEIFYNAVNTTGCSPPAPSTPPTPSTSLVDVGGNSMQTTSFPTSFTLTNGGAGNLIIGSITATPPFAIQSTTCATVAPGGNCTVNVVFTPAAQGTVNGTITVNYSGGSINVNATGVGERSLVSHYYHAILGRNPDGAGKSFWESEATRLSGLGADINEVWFVMAGYFFNSGEYLALGKTDQQFVTDLYFTFYNRAPDSGGLGYWSNQIASGLPREVVLFSFMFTTEFTTFTQGIFGSTAARPEINIVMDFFRGILNRLPDTDAFRYWVNRFRAAQCAGAGTVYSEVGQISAQFIFNPEYNNRNRNNTQYVTDMYYSFLRRGGDIGGVNFWINQLNTGGKDRNTVRTDFINSPEFGSRVNSVVNAGCVAPVP